MPRFSEEVDQYVVLILDLNDFHDSARGLPDGFRLLEKQIPKAIREQERKLLREKFEDWEIPFCGRLKGWREDSPIFVLRGNDLIGGVYLCDRNEFDDDTKRGQVHYMFVRSRWSGRGIYSAMFGEAVRNASSWGLKEIVVNTDRYLLPEVHMRWGAKPRMEIGKATRLPRNKLGRLLRLARQQLRRARQLVSVPCR